MQIEANSAGARNIPSIIAIWAATMEETGGEKVLQNTGGRFTSRTLYQRPPRLILYT